MRQVIKISFGVWTLLTAMLAGVMVLRAQPMDWSDDFGELDFCGDYLCFAGIVVGQTRIEEARDILAPYRVATREARGAPAGTMTALIGNMQVSIVQFQNKGALVNVSVNYNPPLTLDKLILRFGKPCFASITTTSSLIPSTRVSRKSILIQLYYPSIIANTVIPITDNARMELKYPVTLTLTKKLLDCTRKDSLWRGFATLNRYRWQSQP